MVISGLHVNVRTSATVKISRHGFGYSSGLVCTDTVINLEILCHPNLYKFITVIENIKTLKMNRRIGEELMKVLDRVFTR